MATAIVECPRHPRNDTTARPSLVHQRPQTGTDPKSHDPPASPPLSRPLEDCEGCPALAGVRNLGLDDPSAGCSDSHCNSGVGSRVASSGCNAQSRVPQAGVDRPHRSSGPMAGACGLCGTWRRSCGDGGAFMTGVSSFGCGDSQNDAVCRSDLSFQPAGSRDRAQSPPPHATYDRSGM